MGHEPLLHGFAADGSDLLTGRRTHDREIECGELVGISREAVDGISRAPMTPEEALQALRPGDAALGRLDVLPTLAGIDDGMWVLGALEARRVAVLNDAAALFATHDKLLTARSLRRAGVPHPDGARRVGSALSGSSASRGRQAAVRERRQRCHTM
jgi:hypothetical protein